MEDIKKFDNLKLSENSFIKQLLLVHQESHKHEMVEEIFLTGAITKVNRWGFKQVRLIIIIKCCLYNLKEKGKC